MIKIRLITQMILSKAYVHGRRSSPNHRVFNMKLNTFIIFFYGISASSMEPHDNFLEYLNESPASPKELISAVQTLLNNQTPEEALTTKLMQWARTLAPRIVLHTKPVSGLPNEPKNKLINLLKKEQKLEASYQHHPTKKIYRMHSFIDGTKTIRINLTHLDKANSSRTEQTEIILESSVISSALHPRKHQLIFGCIDGTILFYNPLEKSQSSTKSPDERPIDAIAFLDQGNGFVTQSDESTYIWSLGTNFPRLKLENIIHTNTYVCEQSIIRSHIGGRTTTGTICGNDNIYEIPTGYLSGNEPGSDIKKIAVLALLQHNFTDIPGGLELLQKIYRWYVLNTFEPPITYALKEHLRQLAPAYCTDLTLVPICKMQIN